MNWPFIVLKTIYFALNIDIFKLPFLRSFEIMLWHKSSCKSSLGLVLLYKGLNHFILGRIAYGLGYANFDNKDIEYVQQFSTYVLCMFVKIPQRNPVYCSLSTVNPPSPPLFLIFCLFLIVCLFKVRLGLPQRVRKTVYRFSLSMG